ncbi:TPA: transposase, partial [Candidatus Poribacteria bacterium]|nr:transposase [Candidatus Poribacteria bacterium]
WDQPLILNAICYLVATSCQWRMLPKGFLPWKSVYSHYCKWRQQERWFLVHPSYLRFGKQSLFNCQLPLLHD